MRGAALFALLIAACSAPGQLVVRVDTDLSVPSELDAVHIEIVNDRGESTRGIVDDALTQERLPMITTLIPARAGGEVTVTAIGFLRGAPVVEQSARARFPDSGARLLSLLLQRSCVGVECTESTQTCRAGDCVDELVSDLPEWNAAWFSRDASVPDGGTPGPNVQAIEAGPRHSCAIVDGALICWGGEFGAGLIVEPTNVRLVAAGGGVLLDGTEVSSTCWVVDDGTNDIVYCRGSSYAGDREEITRTPSGAIRQITHGATHGCMLAPSTLVPFDYAQCWGDDRACERGALGPAADCTGAGPRYWRPEQADEALWLTAAGDTTCQVWVEGTGVCWGPQEECALAEGDPCGTGRSSSAVQIGPDCGPFPGVARLLTGVERVECGGSSYPEIGVHCCAFLSTSSDPIYCWGASAAGQLGRTTDPHWACPTMLGDAPTAIAVGGGVTCARSAATTTCIGHDMHGIRGDGATPNTGLEPTSVEPASALGALFLSPGTWDTTIRVHAIGVTTSGGPVCWGANDNGQCDASGTDLSIVTPITVPQP